MAAQVSARNMKRYFLLGSRVGELVVEAREGGLGVPSTDHNECRFFFFAAMNCVTWLYSNVFLAQTRTIRTMNVIHCVSIPANFFRDIGVRFLSWECWDFCRRHDHF